MGLAGSMAQRAWVAATHLVSRVPVSKRGRTRSRSSQVMHSIFCCHRWPASSTRSDAGAKLGPFGRRAPAGFKRWFPRACFSLLTPLGGPATAILDDLCFFPLPPL